VATTEDFQTQGWRCFEQGAWPQAEDLFRQALNVDPRNAQLHYSLGLALEKQGRLQEASGCFQQALLCRPDYPEAYQALGACFQRAVAAPQPAAPAPAPPVSPKPAMTAAVYNDLGVPVLDEGRVEEALHYFMKALDLDPNFPPAHNNAAAVHLAQGKLDEAAAHFEHALRFRPDDAQMHCNVSQAYFRLGRSDDALASCHEALRLNPLLAEAYVNRGSALEAKGQFEDVLASFDEALRLKPNLAEAHFSRALTLLLLERFEEGWAEYEWRWGCPTIVPPPLPYPAPVWDGSPLEGRTLLLRAEQGLGDTLHFLRFVPLVARRGGKVVLHVQPPLLRLVQRCTRMDSVIDCGDASFHVHALLMSLPRLLNLSREGLAESVPYLQADPALVESWRNELSGLPGLKVGICWRGNPTQKFDRLRSIPLSQFAALAKVEGVHWISLQKGLGTEQLPEVADRFSVMDLSGRLDDFTDTAAVVKNLDLVITADTAVAHLTGALGVPVWIALPFIPDWRWRLKRDDTNWYPTARLFRQRTPGDWPEVFARIASELARLKDQRSHAGNQ
jgi:tetratricopeptide (TPR) repeat protein